MFTLVLLIHEIYLEECNRNHTEIVTFSSTIAPNDFITSHFNCKEVCYSMKCIVNSFNKGRLACRKEITLSVRFRSLGNTCLITHRARLTAFWAQLLARNLWAGAKTSYFLIAGVFLTLGLFQGNPIFR